MLTYSEVWMRKALLAAAVKVAMPQAKEIEENVVSWSEGLVKDSNDTVTDVNFVIRNIAEDAIAAVINDIIANNSTFLDVSVFIDRTRIYDRSERHVCLLKVDDVISCLWHGIFNDCWFYKAILDNGEEKFIVLS